MLLQKQRNANGSSAVIPMGGVHATSTKEEGIPLQQKHRDRNGRCIAHFSREALSGVDVTFLISVIVNH